ncbi:hypothetical protein SAMN05421767_11011 [Granulicatella balaenopterae]|uniref:DUF985 domain-containing protein n=1 Tax=Granulicatella balaenopterae TaxID=137733 RepID=A0A1H9JRN5_9LACT|nr:cupin domain-containing protein [Granulicatella balaenopterae]SEQ89438.1 hypothetical protein SAMN05421767_11011 [Granulicatella balaenopterae]
MKTAQQWINELEMISHVEGGYFKEQLKSDQTIHHNDHDRALYTSILFLLEHDNPSNFHRLTADEIWYYHDGSPLTVHMIHPDGTYEQIKLGKDILNGEVLQAVVPRGVIFGSSVEEGYALVSCMVAPGFEFEDFTLFKRQELLDQYPDHQEIIEKLTRD